ncbi:hypothetical protein HPB47_006632, partial [Ixodes persulcatus]
VTARKADVRKNAAAQRYQVPSALELRSWTLRHNMATAPPADGSTPAYDRASRHN